ncbi:flagellar basal body rod protein FlgB [Reinekea marina]|uniref:Flagellar basal body rod protein FlgB n=1 Tax=Reinekea marina TaxID=1310421 RepID=A0ABV7WS01_9GAMM|nr:flagellar basal body rod protein FlgB [Reinekea marina]MBU2862924.1 flagellar basal body rod protein FlgB [Reinekea forsetii]MDN3649215.1 flagellar basal body rod protein FlgB [Reinekea marina]
MSALGFNNSLGIHDNALLIRSERSSILANNLANADTPGYKARDIDFKAILAGEVKQTSSLKVAKTDSAHIQGRESDGWEKLYRNPLQPSIDGNTVEEHVENTEFTGNAMQYNSSFEFLNRKFTGLTGAIRGE